jgi:hypothetical protein
MNKVCRNIVIKADFFYAEKGDKPEIYSYEINLVYTNSSFEIVYEKYSRKSSEYAKENIIIESSNGGFTIYNLNKKLKDKFTNLLKKRSFAEIFFEFFKKEVYDSNGTSEELKQSYITIQPLYHFVLATRVILDVKDNHMSALANKADLLKDAIEYTKKNLELLTTAYETGYSSKILFEDELEEYKAEAIKKTSFIKLFKPNIKAIKVESRLVKSSDEEKVYAVNDFIDYGDYSIDIEMESVGIKKLMNLYALLKHLSIGGILVIDELDSHINDVYLIKLIEYISKYSNGQLIFTTHNVSPMETLKSKRNSIDFMSMSGTLSSWTQIGNYSPSKLYKKGMVQGLPFNVEAEDFIGVFDNE